MSKRIFALTISLLIILLTSCEGATRKEITQELQLDENAKIFRDTGTIHGSANPHTLLEDTSFLYYGTMVAAICSDDERLIFVPHHCSELPSSPDGIVWTVKFRDGIKWDDGTLIDANTYYYSMQKLLDPKMLNTSAVILIDVNGSAVKNAEKYLLGEVDWEEVGIKLINKYTLEITLETAISEIDFWTTIGAKIWPVHQELYEKYMNDDGTGTEYGVTIDKMVSCGAWILTEWEYGAYGSYETYVKNPDDPLVKMGYFKLDGIRIIQSDNNSVQQSRMAGIFGINNPDLLFSNGDIDVLAINSAVFDKYKTSPAIRSIIPAEVLGFFVNSNSPDNPILQDKDFRNALYYAAPWEMFGNYNINQGDNPILYNSAKYPISDIAVIVDSSGEGKVFRESSAAKTVVEAFASDNEKAIELFNKAFESNGGKKVKIDIIYYGDGSTKIVELFENKIINLFGKDRIEFSIVNAAIKSNVDNAMQKGDYDLALSTFHTDIFNPWYSMRLWTSEHETGFNTGFYSKEFDELYNLSMSDNYINNLEKRTEYLAQMEYLLLDYGTFIPLVYQSNAEIYSERIVLPTEKYLPHIGFARYQSDIK